MTDLPDDLTDCVGGLTVRDPWAQAVVFGPKRIENRSSKPPSKVVGERVAVHCGQEVDESAWIDCVSRQPPFSKWGDSIDCAERGEDDEPFASRHHPGHIIGTVKIVGWWEAVPKADAEVDYPPSVEGPIVQGYSFASEWRKEYGDPDRSPWWQDTTDYGWLLDNPQPLDEPIPARGQLGVWGLEKQIAKAQEAT